MTSTTTTQPVPFPAGTAPRHDPTPPRPKKAWGMSEVLRAGLVFMATQVALTPVLVLLAMSTYDLDPAVPDFADQMLTALVDVTTTPAGLAAGLLFQWAAFVGSPWLATRLRGHRSLVKDFGLSFRASDLWRGVALAMALQLAMVSLSWLAHQTALDLDGVDNTSMVTDQVGLALVMMVLAASIGAPLTEEIFFRGLLLRAFLRGLAKVDHAPVLPGVTDHFHPSTVSRGRQVSGTVAAVLLSSAIFGAMHASHWLLIVQTGLLGVVLAIVAVRTRRLGLTIVTHVVFNSTSLAAAFLLT